MMKRRLTALALMGAAVLMPMNADAQRPRDRRVERRIEAPRSGRLVSCRAPRDGRSYVCSPDRHDQVVYRYSGRPVARRAWIAPSWGRLDIYLSPGRSFRIAIEQNRLRRMLGAPTVNRIRDHGRRAGLRGQLVGRWTHAGLSGQIMVLTMGGQEVARVFDYDHDGFVDELLLRNFRPIRATW